MSEWLEHLLSLNIRPYIATSELLFKTLDTSLFKGHELVKFLEDPDERNFHEAYLVSNSIGFGNPDLKMQNWVYIDCVLMQGGVIGFAIDKNHAPDHLVEFYERDPYVDVEKLDYIPISGQIASMAVDGKTLVGFSLFSLRRQLSNLDLPKFGPLTKYIALKSYKAEKLDKFVGISQYDNPALKTHILFGENMYIESPMVPLHPLRDMSFIYSMKIKLDENRIFNSSRGEKQAKKYDFLLKADDQEKKGKVLEGIRQNKKFSILEPVHLKQEDGIYLPIKQED